ncbi:signal transducer [Coprinopsis sp. MPI-PUGE-AT-0042]|nr:signal transducer [Coprinopsis sp. MPI-PUGE-AT-0042]
MADSPAGSPRTGTFNSKPATHSDNASLASQPKSEFLDLEEEDEESDDVQQGPTTPTSANFSRSTQSLDLPAEATPSRPRKTPTRGATEEFAQPGSYPSRQQLSVQPDGYPSMHTGGAQEASPTKQLQSPTDHPSNSVHQPQDASNSSRGYNNSSKISPGPPHQHDMTQQPGSQAVSASFRALPLLSTDLPHTAIQVSHSFVRPNDRGKEVLSFIVSVNPGHGKPGWKVEKMYSDVLTLDQRIRQSVGKSVGKKISSLPEGKLWKDHAPAKVDQRKAVLEQYLQSLIQLPIKSNDEVIAFFTSDIVKELKQPVMQVGHKEGYLTKRGKNFGGWKTRFFVLQGPVLEYYDCRGGQQLGSIQITGAQIARQQRKENAPVDEDNEYRHAFLIVEAKKGPGGSHPRHVLCAESDEERDSWVELLVRYHSGSYNEDFVVNPSPGMSSVNSNSAAATSPIQPRASTSSNDSTQRKPQARPPINTEEYTRSASPSRSVDPSPIDRNGAAAAFHDAQMRRIAANGTSGSLPDPSPLSAAPPMSLGTPVSERAASELGHYPDLQVQPPNSARQHSPERHRPREVFEGRHNNYSTSNLSSSQQPDRAPSPEKPDLSKVKISGPMGGTLIPSGFKFGKEPAAEPTTSSADRREKAKSRGFWGFGKNSGGHSNAADKLPNFVPRAVFGIPLEESLDVAQICGLPAIVFRCIEYLESKKADQEEGIYRLSGSSAVIKSLKDRFNLEGDVNLLASDEFWDPHAIAGLLKSFLRDLPSSILTREMHLRFLAVIDLTDAQERIKELAQLIGALPIANYTILRALTAHLILIVQNAHVNKMTMRNVGIVFSPTLGIPAGVFSLMLAEFNRVFNVDMDDDAAEEPAPSDPSEQLSEPVRRNSKRYSDQAADRLLGLSGRSLKAAPPAEDVQSDVDEFSINEDSGTDGDGTTESSSSGPGSAGLLSPPDTPMAPRNPSKASSTAANRGLNVTVTNSDRGNRHSKLIGLPTSPRPSASPSRSQEI